MRTEFGDKFRHWRVKLIPIIALVILLRNLIAARWGIKNLGLRLFFVSLLILLYFWWRMDRKDILHIAEQEERAALDPKHLYDISTGLGANSFERLGMCFSLMGMGGGLIFQAVAIQNPLLIFWGASLAMIGGVIWALT